MCTQSINNDDFFGKDVRNCDSEILFNEHLLHRVCDSGNWLVQWGIMKVFLAG